MVDPKAFLSRFVALTVVSAAFICAMTVVSLSSQACTKNFTLISPEDQRITGLYYGREGDWNKNLINQAIEPRKWQQVIIASTGKGDLLITLAEDSLKGKPPDLCTGLSRIIVYGKKSRGYVVNFE